MKQLNKALTKTLAYGVAAIGLLAGAMVSALSASAQEAGQCYSGPISFGTVTCLDKIFT